MAQFEKVIRDGNVAVLYSPGYGAGWYSWNTDYPQCLFHPKIVELVESDKREEITAELCNKLFKADYFCEIGASDLKIQWLPEGTNFNIDEYDGAESIQTFDDIKLIA